jgi:hypothetical protein
MRLLAAALLLPVLGMATTWPDAIGAYHRTSDSQPATADAAVWKEYGLKAAESAAYENGKAHFSATLWRLQDSTAALAAFDWQRPAGSQPSGVAALAAESSDKLMLAYGNYLLLFDGYKPSPEELQVVRNELRNVDSSSLPALRGYLPSTGLVVGSERYILGPASLARFAPGIPPSTAGFHVSAEAVSGRYQAGKSAMDLTIFDYPTPQIAMQKVEEFAKLPGAMARRTGPMVAVVLSPTDPDAAERLISLVRYQPEIILNERVSTKKDNIGDLVINAFILCGLIGGICIGAGIAMGGYRYLVRRFRKGPDPDAMITLNLS